MIFVEKNITKLKDKNAEEKPLLEDSVG